MTYSVISVHFYRATLCVSADFAIALCLSVCLSVTLVDCIQTAEDVVKLLSPPGSAIILIPSADTQFQGGTHSAGGVKYTGWGVGKVCNFQLKSPFISEAVRDRPMVAMER